MKVEQLLARLEAEIEAARAELAKKEGAVAYLRELLGDEAEPAPARAPRKPKAKRAPKPAKPAHHAPPGESRAAVLEVLTTEWASPGELIAAAGVTKGQGLTALRQLGKDGAAEWNGLRTKSSQWRLTTSKPTKPKTQKRKPVEVEDIENDGPFADEDEES